MRFGRSPISAQVRAALGVADRERVLAWGVGDADAADSSFVVATDQALYDQRHGFRMPWADVVKGTWEEPEFRFTLETAQGVQRVAIALADARDLPAAVRDRVTDTVVVSEYVDLGQEQGAQLVARRDPGADAGDIRWSIVFDAGLDPADPDLRGRADRALADLRESMGI